MQQYIVKSKGIEIYNIPTSFDIETYSFYENKQKCAIMYIFMFNIGGLSIVGRTWGEFEQLCFDLSRVLELSEKKQLFCGVHNLSYEFQFICKRFNWVKVFAIDERKPVYALCDLGINFHCTYLLSGYSLASVAKNLTFKIKKLDTLDYNVARNKVTPLSDEEIQYCLNDVKIVVLYLAELLNTERDLNTIPITKTGFVRRFMRDCCLTDFENKNNVWKRLRYNELMFNMTMNVLEYEMLKRAFQGGFTHPSAWYAGRTVHGVPIASKDETSAYPFALVAYQFPMSSPEHIEIHSKKEFMENLINYCCCFDVCFEDIEATTTFENYISISRCWVQEGCDDCNGRLVSGRKIWTTITEQDFFIIKKMY